MSFIIYQILSYSYLSFACYSMSLGCAQPKMNCSPWTLFCRTAPGGSASPEDLDLSTLNCILTSQWCVFGSSSQFQTRGLSFCRLPAPPGFPFIIYSFVLITSKNTKQHQGAGRILQNSMQAETHSSYDVWPHRSTLGSSLVRAFAAAILQAGMLALTFIQAILCINSRLPGLHF